ncbi:MAG: PD-(D/E)XK nuclease family protein [Treponema sp.]|nr:PD-(D/E)XK nuclease family protein [Treponema sp.]
MTNTIENCLLANIKDKNNYFVFPTQHSADLWADEIITISDVTSVAMERFLAWDTFKANSIRSQHQDKRSIPSVLRQIFASKLLEENKESPFLTSILRKEYAEFSSSFSSWIAKILPALQMWKNYSDKSALPKDDEDKDYEQIYERYSQFLKNNSLFDPAWETPPFKEDSNHYFIFFPEILSDYAEYKNILEKSPANITLIHLEQLNLCGKVNFFDNSRTELNSIALYLRTLHSEKNIPWDKIAINVPDPDTYEPYITRELELYEIPYLTRNAKPLSSTTAGSFFSQLLECYTTDFNFNSIKNLLLNNEIPWLDSSCAMDLIEYGQKNNCICNFTYKDVKYNVWEESFRRSPCSETTVNFYKSLKNIITKIALADSFESIKNHYFEFRTKFFDYNNCSEKVNNILSRCISELSGLIDIEQEFPHCSLSNPFSFFVEQLSSINYLSQAKENGVQILGYKTAACSPFDIHVILDASQQNLSVIYKPLSFLREDKRKLLLGGKNYEDPNVTNEFISLYIMNSRKENTFFTAASKTFYGYSQSVSCLEEINYKDKENPFITGDPYKSEKNWFLGKTEPDAFFEHSVKGFSNWSDKYLNESKEDERPLKIIEQEIRNKSKDNYFSVNYSDLKKFLECPRSWLLRKITNLEEQDNDAQLMGRFKTGNLYHKILELVFNEFKQKNLPLKLYEDGLLPKDYEKIITKKTDEAINYYNYSKPDDSDNNSFLEVELLKTTKNDILKKIKNTVLTISNEFCKDSVQYVAFIEQWFDYIIPDTNIKFGGFVDCILKDNNSNYTIIDYKSTMSAVPGKSVLDENEDPSVIDFEELPDFQMPAYYYLLSKNNPDYNIKRISYFIINPSKSETKSFKDVKLDNMKPTIEKMLECINYYYQKITSNDYTKDYIPFDTCNKCQNKAICRKSFNIAKRS